MPSIIALALCISFVIYLLRIDHKQSSDVSFVTWIPSLWALVAFSRPLDIWFGGSEQATMESGSVYDRIFFLVLLFVALIVLFRRGFSWSKAVKDNRWLIVLVAFMLVSVSWSSISFISFRRWTRESIGVMMAFLLLSERHPQKALQGVLRRVSYILVPFSALLIKFYPKYGIEFGRWDGSRSWIGVATQKNGLARLCIIVLIFLVWTVMRRWQGHDRPVMKSQPWAEGFLIVLSGLLLMGPNRTLTYSATSTVTFIAALITLFRLLWLKKRGFAFPEVGLKIIVMTIVIYGTMTPFIGKLSVVNISSIVKRDNTLTGRADLIWKRLMPFAMSKPILGHGYGGFWTTEMRELTSSHAHNGYLDVILNTGFLGLVLVSLFLLSCCRKAYRAFTVEPEWGILFVCYLIMLVIFNIAESSIDSLTASLTAIVMFFSACSGGYFIEKAQSEDVFKSPPT